MPKTLSKDFHIMDLDENALETPQYNFKDFPVYSKQGLLSLYPSKKALCHWHNDFEFVTVLEGEMYFFVDGKTWLVKKHTGIFVNSGKLHYGYSKDGQECRFETLILPLSLWHTVNFIKEQFVSPLIDEEGSALLLTKEDPWQEKLLNCIQTIHLYCEENNDGFELAVQSQIFHALYLLHHIHSLASPGPAADENGMRTLKIMINFIQSHSSDKISLNDIAGAGAVCRSRCCKLFQQILNTTPSTYLNWYRLEMSMRMLKDTQETITSISLSCGFQSSSHFTCLFHKENGITPSEYRRLNRDTAFPCR